MGHALLMRRLTYHCFTYKAFYFHLGLLLILTQQYVSRKRRVKSNEAKINVGIKILKSTFMPGCNRQRNAVQSIENRLLTARDSSL